MVTLQRNQGEAALRALARSWMPRRTFAAHLALLAIAIQAFVVQTHVHFDADFSAIASVGDAAHRTLSLTDPTGQPHSNDRDHCPICHEQMSGGRSIVLEGIVLKAPTTTVFVALCVEALSLAFRIVSHTWHSRGPPSL